MQLESNLDCQDEPALVRERFCAFLTSRGYRAEGGAMLRGSWWGTLTSFKPSKWAVRATLEPRDGHSHSLRFEVNTTGQVVTDQERKFWNDEFQAALSVAGGGEAGELEQAAASATASGKKILLYAASCSVAFGVIEYIARSRGLPVPPGLAGVGAGVGVAMGLQKTKQRAGSSSSGV